jgi:formylglycine-generating enzyme required for sulfatase activity
LLDANGIYDGQNGNGLIPWKEIKEVVVDRVEDHTYLVWTKDSFSPGRVSSNYDTKLDVTCSTGVDLAIPLNDRAPRKSFLHKFESIQGVPDDWREMLAKIAPNVVVRLKLEGTRHGATLDLLAAPPEKWKKCYQLFPRPTGKEAQEQEVVIHDWDDRDFALAQAQAKAAGNDLKKAVAAYKTYHAKNANGRHVEEADEAIGRISKPGSPKPEAGYRPPVDKKPGDAKPPANPKPPAAEPWPLCDGKETVAAYAMRAGVEPAETLELGVVALELVLIPAGKFLMGSPETKKDRGGGKQETQHEVTITRPYYMGRYEVTQEEYERVMRDNPSAIKGARNPVESVSRWRAEDFCKKASEKTGFTVRLPTEAEWEYACRAGTKTAYYTGDSEADLDRAAWYYKNSNNTTHPVGQKAPNAWGLFDMHGNVEEWCADWYATYKDEAAVDPQGPAQGKLRVSRGGSGRHGPEDCRSAARWLSPTGCDAMSGFRVVAEVRRRP